MNLLNSVHLNPVHLNVMDDFWGEVVSKAFPWIDDLLSYFEGLFRFIKIIFDPFIYAYNAITGAGDLVLELSVLVPGIVGACALCVFALAIVKFIIGR